jgi:DNA polymerase/3'-5' exonuclease PolX
MKPPTERRRFLKFVHKTPTCWLWNGTLFNSGYGQFRMNGKNRRAHRVSYEFFIGPIGEGLNVCHKCDVKRCVRPYHLFVTTQKGNMEDASRKGRMKGRSGWGKLSVETIRFARKRYRQRGITIKTMAKALGVARSSLNKAIRGLTYRNVPDPVLIGEFGRQYDR